MHRENVDNVDNWNFDHNEFCGILIFCEQLLKKLNKFKVSATMYKIDGTRQLKKTESELGEKNESHREDIWHSQ